VSQGKSTQLVFEGSWVQISS